MKKLIIIAGGAGEIGTAYCKHFLEKGYDVIAPIRNTHIQITHNNLTQIVCELSSIADIEEKFTSIHFSQYSQVLYVHTIGADKFDPRGYPNIHKLSTIEPSVYDTNVNSFKYLMHYLVRTIAALNKDNTSKIKLGLAMIGGVSDKYAPFVIESFCEAKYIIRQYIRNQVDLYPEFIYGISINITSTITKSALSVRPYAETLYWLTPDEVVHESKTVLADCSSGYTEKDIVKFSPDYTVGYYEDNEALYKKWSKETGIV